MEDQSGQAPAPCGELCRVIRGLRGPKYDRLLRLFAGASCHCIWHVLSADSRRDLAIVEWYAGGLAAEEEANEVANASPDIVGDAAGGAGFEAAQKAVWVAARALARTPEELEGELASLRRLMREFVGPTARAADGTGD